MASAPGIPRSKAEWHSFSWLYPDGRGSLELDQAWEVGVLIKVD
jgi:hypothetical protein